MSSEYPVILANCPIVRSGFSMISVSGTRSSTANVLASTSILPTLSGCGVNIAAHQSGRLPLHQITAIGILAYHLITGGKICDHRSRCHGMITGWWDRHPKILADINAKYKIRQIICSKQKLCSKRDLFTVIAQSRNVN